MLTSAATSQGKMKTRAPSASVRPRRTEARIKMPSATKPPTTIIKICIAMLPRGLQIS